MKKLMHSRTRIFAAVVVVVAAIAMPLGSTVKAVFTRNFTFDDAASFGAGDLTHTSVFSDGTLRPGNDTQRIALDDAQVVYSIAKGPSDTTFLGTGNDGKIFRVEGNSARVFAETHALVVSALVFHGDTLYAGTLPEGRIFAVNSQGVARELVKLEGADHIWAMVWDNIHNGLVVGTGPNGKTFFVTQQAAVSTLYDATQTHILSLAVDAGGNVFAGTSDQGLVYRITAPTHAEVVWDFPGNEVTSLAWKNGVLAVAANEFADTVGAPAAATAPAPAAAPAAATTARPVAAPRPRSGKGKIFRVGNDGRVEQLFAVDDTHFTVVAIDDANNIAAAAGKDGRIYRIAADRSTSTWMDVDERQVVSLIFEGENAYFGTTDAAAFYRTQPGTPATMYWTSKVQDAEFRATFGMIRARGEGRFDVQTRSGNTLAPDTTWSDWSQPATGPTNIASPSARYLQVRVRFSNDRNAIVRSVSAYYLPQNQRAIVRGITAARRIAGRRVDAPAAPAAPGSADAQPSVDDLPGTSSTVRISWHTDNPDTDRIRYRLEFRAESQNVWRPITRETDVLTRTDYAWETNSVADGYYRVRIRATDELSNPPDLTTDYLAESGPILVDNHAPTLEATAARANANPQRITGHATDAVGPIARFEFAVDGGDWKPFYPNDNLFDAPTEAFTLDLPNLTPGAHVIAIRAADEAGNTAIAEVNVGEQERR